MSWYIRFSYHQLIFSVCSFQGTLLTDFSSAIRNLNRFKSLITGETSYQNSTSLLIGSALKDCCPSLPVFMPKDFARSFRALVGWYFRILGKVFRALDFWSFLIRNYVFFLFLIWRPPTLPHRLQCSTIGRLGLNHRVRDGNGCCPQAHRHQKILVILITQQ